jgi:hypothetical protein
MEMRECFRKYLSEGCPDRRPAGSGGSAIEAFHVAIAATAIEKRRLLAGFVGRGDKRLPRPKKTDFAERGLSESVT